MSKEIWQEFLRGNEDAFSELYRTYYQELLMYGVKIGFDKEVCKDAVQDVFYNIYTNSKKLIHVENIEFYLIQCVRNRLFDIHSRAIKINRINYNDIILKNQDNVVEQIINKERQLQTENAISKCFKSLSPKQRKIIYYHYQLNLDVQEIAAILEMTPSAIKKSFYRALQKMKTMSSQLFNAFFSFL